MRRDFLRLMDLSREELLELLERSAEWKLLGRAGPRPLERKAMGLVFEKASTRTRVSFAVAAYQLGGYAMMLSPRDMQLGRGEPVKDTARVMGRMLHGVVFRTFAQRDVEEFAELSGIPTVNALTDEEHPCQILADLFTISEKLGGYEGKTICFVGDGACNVPRSWLWAASKLDFTLKIAAPKSYQPEPELLAKINRGNIVCTDDLQAAARDADVLYTDVWVSMGREDEAAYRMAQLGEYRIDEKLVAVAKPGALVMHCLPAYRGKEITDEIFERHAATIFDQAENRLHAQKAILSLLAPEA